jgi:hypothetical protein
VTGLHATLVSTVAKGDARGNVWVTLSDNPAFLREGDRVERLVYATPPPVRWTDERSSLMPVFRAFGVSQEGIALEPVQWPVPRSTPVAEPAGP